LEKLRYYCKAQDPEWEITKEYVEEGASGRTIKREKYQQMFDEIDLWDAILVVKLDRIHRNSRNMIDMMNFLKKHDKEFVSQTEHLDTSTAMGRFVAKIIFDIAELESDVIAERTYVGMAQKAITLDKGRNGGKAPFGFEWETDYYKDGGRVRSNSVLIPIPEQIEIVKKSFELYNKGWSILKIAETFDLSPNTPRYFLSNPIYVGVDKWANNLKENKNVEPVISEMLFNKVQRRRCKFKNQHGDQEFNVKTGKGSEVQPLLIKSKKPIRMDLKKIKDIVVVHKGKHSLNNF